MSKVYAPLQIAQEPKVLRVSPDGSLGAFALRFGTTDLLNRFLDWGRIDAYYWMLFRFARPWSCRAEGIVTKYEYLTVLQDLTRKRDALIEAVDSLYYAIQIGAITDAPEIPQRARNSRSARNGKRYKGELVNTLLSFLILVVLAWFALHSEKYLPFRGELEFHRAERAR